MVWVALREEGRRECGVDGPVDGADGVWDVSLEAADEEEGDEKERMGQPPISRKFARLGMEMKGSGRVLLVDIGFTVGLEVD